MDIQINTENNKQNDLNKMLLIDNILQSINVNQKYIEDSIFENLLNYEIKKDFDKELNKLNNLFMVSANSGYKSNLIKIETKQKPQVMNKSLFTSNENNYQNNNLKSSIQINNKNDNNEINQQKKKTNYSIIENKTILKNNDENQKEDNSNNNSLSNQFYKKLLNSFKVIFEDEFINYSIIQSKYHLKNYVFTFLSSVLTIFDESFILKNEKEREIIIKSVLKKMHDTSVTEGNYQKFYYHRNRKFKKEIFHSVMNKSLTGKVDMEEFYIIQQYICDFFGINLFIFYILPSGEINYDKSTFYATKQFKGKINPYVPSICLLYSNELFYPIVHKTNENDSILRYSKHNKILLNIWNYIKIEELLNFKDEEEESSDEDDNKIDINNSIDINELNEIEETVDKKNIINNKKKFDLQELSKLKLDELQKIASDNNILITKASDRTGKQIKKIKSELIDDILKV